MNETDIYEVERFLMKLGGGKAPVNCTVGLEISSSGAWVLKFRPIGLIVNNRELLLDDIKVDANLKFSDCGSFWRLINGLATTDEEVKDGSLVANGNQDYVEFLRLKCVKAQEKQSLASVDNVPIRETRQFTTTSEQPLKAGWLLKKREILAGWRCRYFVVYKDRIEYFVDPHDVRTRGVISLVGASVLPLKKVSINGVSDYWEIPLKTPHDKRLRLASERTGVEGMVEASSWEQVFAIAVHEEGDRFEDTSPLRRSLIGSIRRRGSGAGKAKPITDAVPIQTVSDLSSSQVDSTLIDQSSIAAVNNPNIELKGSEIGWRHIVGILIIVVAATAIIARFLGFASSIRYFVGLLSILGVVGIYLTKYALPNRSEESSEFADDGSDLGSSKTLKRIKSFISIFSEKSNPEDDSKKSDGKRKSGLTRAFQRFFKKQRDEDLLTTSVETTPKAKQNKLASKITGAFRPRNDSVDRTTTDLGLDSTPTRNFNGRKKLAEAVRKLVRRRRRGDNKSSDAKNSSSGSEQGYDSREEPDAIETFSDDDNMNRTVPDIPIRSPNYSRTISKDSKSNSTSR